MLPPVVHTLFVLAGVGSIVLGALIILFHTQINSFLWAVGDRVRLPHGERRGCRYCLFGCARLREEHTRVEGDDLVEVRCWVCASCGLPQWTVARTAVLKRTA